MALKRISDLQNLQSTYTNHSLEEKLNNCLIEVSYANPDTDSGAQKAYQSFYLSVPDMISGIIDQIGLGLSDEFVTLKNDQTITGKKTFTNEGGTVFNRIVFQHGDAYTNLCATTDDKTKIENALQNTYIVPTTYAVKQYANNFVSIAGTQTITGQKTFTNANGIVINGGKIKGATNLSADIENAASNLSVVPTTWAVKNYLSTTYLPLTAFIDPSGDIQDVSLEIARLRGLLNNKNMVIYVDSSSTYKYNSKYANGRLKYTLTSPKHNSTIIGAMLTNEDGTVSETKQIVFQNLYDAIEVAKLVKFLENSQCYIRILSDQTIQMNNGSPKTLYVAHPDLTSENKRMNFIGWQNSEQYDNTHYVIEIPNAAAGDKGSSPWSNAGTRRKISFNVKGLNGMYKTWILCECFSKFNYIEFDGGLVDADFDNEWKLTSNKSSYCIRSTVSYPGADVASCIIRGCENGLFGLGFRIINCTFYCVHTPIDLSYGGFSTIDGALNILKCYYAIKGSFGSSLHMYPSSKGYWRIQTGAKYPFVNNGGSIAAIDMAAYGNNMFNASNQVLSGFGFHLQHRFSNDISSYCYVSRVGGNNATPLTKAEFNNAIFGAKSNGYQIGGFVSITYGDNEQAKNFTNAPTPYDDNTLQVATATPPYSYEYWP